MNNLILKGLIFVLLVSFLWSISMWSKYENLSDNQSVSIKILSKKVDSLQIKYDSINEELFPTQIELGRYKIAYEIFMERNPKSASQFGDIISKETE